MSQKSMLVKGHLREPDQQPLFVDSEQSSPIIEVPGIVTPWQGAVLETRVETGLNDIPGYGINLASLAPFLREVDETGQPVVDTMSYIALTKILEVLNNTESLDGRYGFAHSIRGKLDTVDNLALDAGLHPIKFAFYLGRNNFKTWLELAKRDFPHFISKVVGLSYREFRETIPLIAKYHLGYARHPRHSGDLIRRIRETPQRDIEKAMSSLTLAHRHPGSTTRELRYEFKKPHVDMQTATNYQIRLALAQEIVDFYQRLYIANTSAERAA